MTKLNFIGILVAWCFLLVLLYGLGEYLDILV